LSGHDDCSSIPFFNSRESPYPVWSDTLLRPDETENNNTPPETNQPAITENYENEIEDMYMDIPIPQQQTDTSTNTNATQPQAQPDTPKAPPKKPIPMIDFNKLQRSIAKKSSTSRSQKQNTDARGILVPPTQPKATDSLTNGHTSNIVGDDVAW
jgi:hypothetical protein